MAVACAAFPGAVRAQRGAVAIVEIAPQDVQVRVGQTHTFTATAYDRANNAIAAATFSWSSNNARVVTIDPNGNATGRAEGTAIITVVTGTGPRRRSAQATVQVIPAVGVISERVDPRVDTVVRVRDRPAGAGCAAWERQPEGTGTPEALVVTPLRLTLVRGEVRPLEYRTVRGDGGNAARVCIVFEPDPAGVRVASVDSFGVVTAGTDTGRTTVRAVVQGRAPVPPRTVTLEVRADTVRFSRGMMSVSPGMIDTLEMEVPQQDRQLNPAGLFQFVSTDPSKVRVSPVRPIIQALEPGTAQIIAQSSVYEDLTITVNVHRRVAALVGAPADSVVTIAIGGTTRLEARALAEDSSPVSEAPLRWTMPDSAVARLDTTAKTLRGVRVGETRVAVSVPFGRDSSIERHWRVRVVAGGLAVSRARVGLGVGERTPIAVQLLDDRRQPIGPATQLTWSSSRDSVAVFENGEIVGRSMGRARLTARAAWDSTIGVEVFVVGPVLVSAQEEGRWDLYMAVDSATTMPLTQDSVLETQATWAPDLTRIAYVASAGLRSANFDLYVADADGRNATRLTNDSATVRFPTFVRPAGERIVYESNRGGRAQLYIIGRDGSGSQPLTRGEFPSTSPSVSPDGQKVLFISLRETSPGTRNYDVYEMNLDGTSERRLTTSSRPEDAPVYAPDGGSILYLRDDGGSPPSKRVYRQEPGSDLATPLTPVGMFVQAFSVSADGSALALTTLVTTPDGSQTPRVVSFDVRTGAVTPWHTPPNVRLAGPALRPATPRPR